MRVLSWKERGRTVRVLGENIINEKQSGIFFKKKRITEFRYTNTLTNINILKYK